MSETESLLVLNAIRGLGNAGIRKLLERFGSAAKIMSLREADLSQDRVIPANVIPNILHFSQDKFLKSEYNLMNKRGVKVVTWLDNDYPESLREIADAPVVLYVKGDILCAKPLSMAIVGSRRASFYGISASEKFARLLAELGFTVISGLARGIDTAAHKGALKTHGVTIAVLGCGLSNIYPLENKDLLENIATTGAVVSEFPMQTMPVSYNFPRRNRIISGLSMGVIVVEAAQRSGALITADYALEQGREVYAIPGKIDQAASQGVNGLIKQGAKLITSVEDILEDIQPRISTYLKDSKNGSPELQVPSVPVNNSWDAGDRGIGDQIDKLSEQEKLLYDHITDRPVHVDELFNCCDKGIPVMSVLLQLELKQLVKQLPGKLFTR